jgi:hypothetical protein
MKNIVYLILLFNLTSGFAQVTLQVNTHRPSAGDTLKQYIIDTSGFTSPMPNNISGNNVTWNYSSIINTGTITTQAYVSNTAVASSTNFTGCNLVLSQGPGAYNYLKTVNTPSAQLELLGLDFGTFAKITFTNSAILLKYPFGYSNSFTDPASGTFSANTGTSTINGSSTGNFASNADGFGTLILGQQAIPNVLRVKSTQNFTLFQGFLPLGTIRAINYAYYDQNNKFPLFQVQYQTLSLIAQSPSTTASVRMNASIPLLGLNEISTNENIKIFPIPAFDFLYIHLEKTGDYEMEILDMNGRTTLKERFYSHEYKADVRRIPDGVYLVRLRNSASDKISQHRFVKISG